MEEDASKDKDKSKATSGQASGASTKGSNTPSGRPSKHPEPAKLGESLKRPGSPNLSEASGTESARKKQKKQASSQPQSQTISRPLTPQPSAAQPPRAASSISANMVGNDARKAGPGSDGEAGSGAEMSDGARKMKVKMRMGSPNGTAQSSRAGSPVAGSSNKVAGSRAGSPTAVKREYSSF